MPFFLQKKTDFPILEKQFHMLMMLPTKRKHHKVFPFLTALIFTEALVIKSVFDREHFPSQH